MDTIIYIDILFLLNMCLDFIVIATTAFFTGRECNIRRVLLSSAFGAIYSTIIFFPELNSFNIVIIKIIVSCALIAISFKITSLSLYIKTTVIYYIINFLYGGCIYAFHRFTILGSKINYSNGEYYIDMPLWLIITVCISFYFLVKILSTRLNNSLIKNETVKVTIVLNEKRAELTALIDTGNSLYDPISSLPVMIVQKDALKNLINCDSLFSKNSKDFYENIKTNKLRIIPFCDASGKKETLYAFKPSRIFLTDSGVELNQMLVGITDHKLSINNDYCALLHSKTFTRR